MPLHYALTPKPSRTGVAQAGQEIDAEKWQAIGQWLSDDIKAIFYQIQSVSFDDVEEIRMRIGQPLLIQTKQEDFFLNSKGKRAGQDNAYQISREDLIRTIERMTYSSLYAAEEELKQGFITLPGGHRVGITGEAVLSGKQIQTLKNISALNIRIARDIKGKALKILPYLLNKEGILYHTLILSIPRAGKTTLLRELIYQLSEGVPKLELFGQTVGVVDERGELAGMWQGVPAYSLGCRTDILDGCPKSLGIEMLVRSMAPRIIAVDELGQANDVEAITDAVRTGASILSTAHASSMEEAMERPSLKPLFDHKIFERYVVLNRRQGPGTIEGIYDRNGFLLIQEGQKC